MSSVTRMVCLPSAPGLSALKLTLASLLPFWGPAAAGPVGHAITTAAPTASNARAARASLLFITCRNMDASLKKQPPNVSLPTASRQFELGILHRQTFALVVADVQLHRHLERVGVALGPVHHHRDGHLALVDLEGAHALDLLRLARRVRHLELLELALGADLDLRAVALELLVADRVGVGVPALVGLDQHHHLHGAVGARLLEGGAHLDL